jgi:hypothetical protein
MLFRKKRLQSCSEHPDKQTHTEYHFVIIPSAFVSVQGSIYTVRHLPE